MPHEKKQMKQAYEQFLENNEGSQLEEAVPVEIEYTTNKDALFLKQDKTAKNGELLIQRPK